MCMYIYTYVNMYMYISIYAYYMQKTRFICERTCTYIIGGKLDIYISVCVVNLWSCSWVTGPNYREQPDSLHPHMTTNMSLRIGCQKDSRWLRRLRTSIKWQLCGCSHFFGPIQIWQVLVRLGFIYLSRYYPTKSPLQLHRHTTTLIFKPTPATGTTSLNSQNAAGVVPEVQISNS